MTNSRRNFIKKATLASSLVFTGIAGVSVPSISFAASLSKKERDALTPDQVIEWLQQGNTRFVEQKQLNHDYLAQKKVAP